MSKFIPNSFQIPNAFVDEMMRDLSGGAVKCYLLVTRYTTGWQRESDSISIAKFKAFTGIKDKRTISSVLEELEIYGLIRTKKNNGEITEFFLEIARFVAPENSITSSKKCTQYQKMQPVAKNDTAPVAKNVPATSSKKCTSIKNNINTKNKNNNTSVLALCREHGVDDDLAKDFLQYRKSIKAPLTINAVKGLVREAGKASMSLSDVLELLMVRGWRGFNADWVSDKPQSMSRLPPVDYSAIVEVYNTVVMETDSGLPTVDDVHNLSDDRKKQIYDLAKILHKRFGNYSAEAFGDYFRDFVEQANARRDRFYFGGLDGSSWKADFDYILREKTFTKTVENSL